jgi:hypothetical protein
MLELPGVAHLEEPPSLRADVAIQVATTSRFARR